MSAFALRCKASIVTHAVEVLLPGIHFHTKDPDCVNDTVNISQFTDFSLSAGSKVSMVTRKQDTELYANTLMSYANAAVLVNQQRTPPHRQLGSRSEDVRSMVHLSDSPPRLSRALSGGV